jgi:hypothetical protein
VEGDKRRRRRSSRRREKKKGTAEIGDRQKMRHIEI